MAHRYRVKQTMNFTRKPSEVVTKQLLAEAQLPIDDITPEHLKHFVGAWSERGLEGVIGLEFYGSVALLRSLAVRTTSRCSGLGAQLVSWAEDYAMKNGVRSLFLLTTTAKRYFDKHGYTVIARESVPDAIRATAEFSSICPTTAVLMVKHIPSPGAQ